MPASEVGEPVLEEDQTDGVLEKLDFGVVFEAFLNQQVAHPAYRSALVTSFAKDLAGLVSVKPREVTMPPPIAADTFGVVDARDHPASNVLAARRQSQLLRRIRI